MKLTSNFTSCDSLVIYLSQDLLEMLLEIEIILERILSCAGHSGLLTRDGSLQFSIRREVV